MEEKKASLLFHVKSRLIHGAVWQLSFCGFISHLFSCETINIPEIFSGVHGFTGKTVKDLFEDFYRILKI